MSEATDRAFAKLIEGDPIAGLREAAERDARLAGARPGIDDGGDDQDHEGDLERRRGDRDAEPEPKALSGAGRFPGPREEHEQRDGRDDGGYPCTGALGL